MPEKQLAIAINRPALLMLSYIRLYLLTLLVLLSLTLVEKGWFAYYHSSQFNTLSAVDILHAILWGIRFDLAVVGLLTFLAWFGAYLAHRLMRRDFAVALQYSTFAAATLLLLLLGADMLYYGEAGRHLGYELKEGINSGASLALAALSTYIVPVLLQLTLLVPYYIVIRYLFRRYRPASGVSSRPLRAEVALIILLLSSGVMVRGGIQPVPMEPLKAQSIGDPAKAAIALNGAYNAIFSIVTPHSVNPLFDAPPTEQELAILQRMYHSPLPEMNGETLNHNVVVVLLESWSAAYMASYGHDQITTPNFDRLRNEGLSTRAMLASGSRTTEGMFATFCSAQNPLGQTVAQSQLQNFNYDCVPEMLRTAGWHTAFFQATNKETSGTGSFAQLLGFEHSYGKIDIREEGKPRLEPNSWGYHDPDLYRYALSKMQRMPQPFLVGINTNSTHDSQLPEGVEPLLPGDSRVDRYRNALHFADGALNSFIETVRGTPELQDTLFILVADHTGLAPSQPLEKHLIPFAILAPGQPPLMQDIVATQRDIAPTLMHLLNIPIPRHFSGNTLLNPEPRPHYADYYHQGILGWVEGDQAIEFPLSARGRLTCLSLKQGLESDQVVSCEENSEAMQQRALAFTHISQSLLFSGNLEQFAELR